VDDKYDNIVDVRFSEEFLAYIEVRQTVAGILKGLNEALKPIMDVMDQVWTELQQFDNTDDMLNYLEERMRHNNEEQTP
jgi:DNA repair ATPase RecN